MDLPISTSDALPLSYRRLVVARPLGSCDKHTQKHHIDIPILQLQDVLSIEPSLTA